ncbi:uncharacterized protein A1O9_06817 [Exophiala aquamarina CBS 119918]|uniref:F-box domain-containing protein n=1 Tax=Exophiala aquamarina CBS 119918 TaxID=1182545 RepID=A0A072PBI2_9EURO|nr:uncharacterized protein A1O9_06817 [Exophiala aquamarina CBS 119918]KEF56628.1 hypothetical protein A1O9_06817 [Exophiala aquamarina CBS 119918]
MTLRNPERLFTQEGYENDDEGDDFVPTLSQVIGQPVQPPIRHPTPDIIIHPIFTDFSPQTLAQYLRSEIEKLRTPAKHASSSTKGKGRTQYQPSSPPSRTRVSKYSRSASAKNIRPIFRPATVERLLQQESNATSSLAVTWAGEIPQTQPDDGANALSASDTRGLDPSPPDNSTLPAPLSSSPNSSQGQTSSSTSSARRSNRLAGRGPNLAGVADGQDHQLIGRRPSKDLLHSYRSICAADSENTDPTSTSLLGGSQSRRSNFEAHTKSKREAGRAVTDVSTTSLEETDVFGGQPSNKARPRKAPARPNDLVPVIPLDGYFADSESNSLHNLQEEDTLLGEGSGNSHSSHSHNLQEETTSSDTMLIAGNLDAMQLSFLERPPQSGTARSWAPVPFDYSQVVPESIPKSYTKDFLDLVRKPKIALATSAGDRDPQNADNPPAVAQSEERLDEKLFRLAEKSFPRVLPSTSLPFLMEPKTKISRAKGGRLAKLSDNAFSKTSPARGLEDFNADLWLSITKYLSTRDIGILRLVNSEFCEALSPIQFRNVVINFDKPLFNNCNDDWNSKSSYLPQNSMFQKYGDNLNQLGISFEYDIVGLSKARPKVIEKVQEAWFGSFTWPTEHYPRFPELQKIEDLVDNNRPLLKEAFKYVNKASELGLCIDSGHGWLEGPDMSDMAVLSRRASRGSKIFGKTFQGEDVLDKLCRNEYFKWAQQNSIHEAIKNAIQAPSYSASIAAVATEVRWLEKRPIREMDSFKIQHEQEDFDPESHVGGAPGSIAHHGVGNPNPHVNWAQINPGPPHNAAVRHQRVTGNRQASAKKQPQWPLIFNGHNIAAEMGGHCAFVQNKTALPLSADLRPGSLTEAQAQWLMETAWAQRAFLSAYTTAIITNKTNFTRIHTLRISKLSSGLLSSLAQKEFWTSLPSLGRLQMLISPDWRQEHITGDRFYQTSMPIPPHTAAEKFTQFLRLYVLPIESLHSLSIGYVGGGEHGVGIFARNQHVLPAPIVEDPRGWLHENDTGRPRSELTKFEHIRDLGFENCWFSPEMLQDFMSQSHDTSLHSLTLDSVSLLTQHDPSIDQPLTTGGSNLRCHHVREEWLHEELPSSATWTRVIDSITPGVTLMEHKYAAGLIDETTTPQPAKAFRGHIQKIILNSCGYVKITLPRGVTNTTFNQCSAVMHLVSPVDSGIRARRERFSRLINLTGTEMHDLGLPTPLGRMQDQHDIGSNRTMMSTSSPDGEVYPWLGTLTQCVHPIEKRVLEMAWGLKFGWSDRLERWASVEDGFYEGGTGRFTGIIDKDTRPQGKS